MHRLVIHKEGVIAGGFVDYEIFEDGLVKYFGKIDVKFGFMKKSQGFGGDYHVNPNLTLSETYKAPRPKERIEGLEVEILELSQVRIYEPTLDLRIAIQTNTSEHIVSILSIQAKGNVFGLRLSLRATAQ